MGIKIVIANKKHIGYSAELSEMYKISAQQRGTGIAVRTPEYIESKMQKQDAVIALEGNKLVGFCYIEKFDNKKYVSNSGLIVHPDYRKMGIAKQIKQKVFHHARNKYPDAKVFGITTSLAVMRINSSLGYHPVTFSELTKDETFWKGCSSCSNYDILTSKDFQLCLCTGMLAPSKIEAEQMKVDLTAMITEKAKP